MADQKQPRYVKMPDGHYVEWPENVSAADFKAKVSGRFGNAPSGPVDPSGRTPTGEPAPGDKRSGYQRTLDTLISRDPRREEWQTPFQIGRDALIRGIAEPAVSLASHPINTIGSALKGFGTAIAEGHGDPVETGQAMFRPLFENAALESGEAGPGYALPHAAGQLVGGTALGEVGGAVLPPAAKLLGKTGTAIRTAAIGDADAAAMRGLGVSGKSPKFLRTQGAVQGARPFLQGVNSLEELQQRIPEAKGSIWAPYKNVVERIGDKVVDGPEGRTTVGNLEQQRQQLSALNRALKQRDPQAIQLAQQKGLTQAELLNQERAVQQALDPHLEEAGIKPQDIRKAFGQISEIQGRTSGKSTLTETPQRYGFGRIANLSFEKPFSAPGEIMGGARDIIAGRPLLYGKPTDIALREGFRLAGDMPNFFTEFQRPQLPYGTHIPEAPPQYPRLPATAGPGEVQPMMGWQRPYVEPPEPTTIRPMPPRKLLQLPSQTAPSVTEPYIAHRTIESGPAGETTRIAPPQFLRPGETPSIPPGSAYRDINESQFYPPGSQFRESVKPFDIEEYLRQNATRGK
jgi:hypothetical protein